MKICGVYCWTHTPTERRYVGSSVDCMRRKRAHEAIVRKGGVRCFHFQRQVAKLGWEYFTFEILETCAANERLEREAHYITTLNTIFPAGFNIQKDPMVGPDYHVSEEMRSAASIRWSTPEARAAQSAKVTKFFASAEARLAHAAIKRAFWSSPESDYARSVLRRKKSPEHVAKMRASLRGRKLPPETVARIAAKNRGKKRSPDHIAKLLAANLGKKCSPEKRAKISAARRGQKPSLETLAKLRGRKLSPEHIAKIAETRLRNKQAKQAPIKPQLIVSI